MQATFGEQGGDGGADRLKAGLKRERPDNRSGPFTHAAPENQCSNNVDRVSDALSPTSHQYGGQGLFFSVAARSVVAASRDFQKAKRPPTCMGGLRDLN